MNEMALVKSRSIGATVVAGENAYAKLKQNL